MARRKDIYFFVGKNGQMIALFSQISLVLKDCLGMNFYVFDSPGEIIRRLRRRKNRINLLVLADGAIQGISKNLCRKVRGKNLPLKVVFVRSSFSLLDEKEIEKCGDFLEKAGMKVLRPLSLTEVYSVDVMRQLI